MRWSPRRHLRIIERLLARSARKTYRRLRRRVHIAEQNIRNRMTTLHPREPSLDNRRNMLTSPLDLIRPASKHHQHHRLPRSRDSLHQLLLMPRQTEMRAARSFARHPVRALSHCHNRNICLLGGFDSVGNGLVIVGQSLRHFSRRRIRLVDEAHMLQHILVAAGKHTAPRRVQQMIPKPLLQRLPQRDRILRITLRSPRPKHVLRRIRERPNQRHRLGILAQRQQGPHTLHRIVLQQHNRLVRRGPRLLPVLRSRFIWRRNRRIRMIE